MSVNARQKYVYLPAATSAGSFLVLFFILFSTSPIRNISYAIVFFGALLVFIISMGYLAIYLQNGSVRPRARYRLLMISLMLVIILMLRSTQSLGWGDILVLVIISVLMLFYTGRRIY